MHSSAVDGAAALADYRKAMALANQLAGLDPGSSNWHETMAAIHAKLGDFLRHQSQSVAAADNYRESVAIAEKLVMADPQNQEPKYVLADAYFGLGEISSARAEGSSQGRVASLHEARSWYQRSSDEWRQISRPVPVSSDGFAWGGSKAVTRALEGCEGALAKLKNASPSSSLP